MWENFGRRDRKEEKLDPLVEAEKRGLLMEQDREMITQGLSFLTEHLRASPERFPDVVVISDVGARPFIYAVKPIIDRLALEFQRPQPLYRFMVPQSGESGYVAFLGLDSSEEEVVLDLTYNEEQSKHRLQEEIGMNEEYFISREKSVELEKDLRTQEAYLQDQREVAKNAYRSAKALIQRGQDIVQEVALNTPHLEADIHVLAIDDYLDQGSTFAQLDYAVENIAWGRGVDFRYFPFFTNTDDQTQRGDRTRVLTGNAGSQRDFPAFTFMRRYKIASREEEGTANRRRVGVEKDPGMPHVRRVNDATSEEKIAAKVLRSAMVELGDSFVKKL